MVWLRWVCACVHALTNSSIAQASIFRSACVQGPRPDLLRDHPLVHPPLPFFHLRTLLPAPAVVRGRPVSKGGYGRRHARLRLPSLPWGQSGQGRRRGCLGPPNSEPTAAALPEGRLRPESPAKTVASQGPLTWGQQKAGACWAGGLQLHGCCKWIDVRVESLFRHCFRGRFACKGCFFEKFGAKSCCLKQTWVLGGKLGLNGSVWGQNLG